MMLQSGGPPDTASYYHVAYVWVAVVYTTYPVLLWIRDRRVRRRLAEASAERDA